MTSDTLITLALTTLSGAAGFFLKHIFDCRKEAEIKRIEDRREHYKNLVLCLKPLSEGRQENDNLLEFEYSFAWLYASDSVICLFNNLRRHLRSEGLTPEVALQAGELLLAIRKDLGIKTSLAASDFEGDARRGSTTH